MNIPGLPAANHATAEVIFLKHEIIHLNYGIF
jgi:hypothetical protein